MGTIGRSDLWDEEQRCIKTEWHHVLQADRHKEDEEESRKAREGAPLNVTALVHKMLPS